jgi:formylglycine-generating enzyme required for sulfatase activity
LIQISADRGALVRVGNALQQKTEQITVSGYELELAKGLAITMVQIPAGSFQMGSPATEAEREEAEGPQHGVLLQSFFLGQTPVTQAQWKEVASWPQVNLKLNPDPAEFKGVNRPVEHVNWKEAMEFCHRLRQRTNLFYTLPSEAQWEYACRAGTTTPFAFGDTLTSDLANYDGTFAYGSGPKGQERKETTEVGSFAANAWGLQDMHGNVWEWCLDCWHDDYAAHAPRDGSAWLEKLWTWRVLRGGSWNNSPRRCRSAYRHRKIPDYRNPYFGFRLCRFPPGEVS